jgi:hypothetical protein
LAGSASKAWPDEEGAAAAVFVVVGTVSDAADPALLLLLLLLLLLTLPPPASCIPVSPYLPALLLQHISQVLIMIGPLQFPSWIISHLSF